MSLGELETDDQVALRDRMVGEQLEARGVHDARVLAAMRDVPRHEFVPSGQHRFAYDDRPLSIGDGQTISQPYMVAIMTGALCPATEDLVLEVGTGSGYQAAVLSKLVREVISIEFVPQLADRARATLVRLGVSNVTVIAGDGSEGFATRQPYNGIIVTAGAPRVPDTLRHQLADGGRLVIPAGTTTYQQLLVIRRLGDSWQKAWREGCVFVPLQGRHGWG